MPHYALLFFSGADDQVLWRTVNAEELAPSISFSVDYCDSLHDAQERIAARSSAPLLAHRIAAGAGRPGAGAEGGQETLFWFTLHHSVRTVCPRASCKRRCMLCLLDGALPPAPNGIARASQAEQQYLASELAVRDRRLVVPQAGYADHRERRSFPGIRHGPSPPGHSERRISRPHRRTVGWRHRPPRSRPFGRGPASGIACSCY